MIAHSERYHREQHKRLIEKADAAGLSIIEDKINRRGGICRLDGKVMVIYDKNSTWQERNRLIDEALRLADKDDLGEVRHIDMSS